MENPPWGAEPRFELGPAIQQANYQSYPSWRKNCSRCHQISFQTPAVERGGGGGAQSTYIYLEYHSVCPLVQIRTPLSRNQKGGTHSPAGEGVQFGRLEKRPSTLSILWGGVTSPPPPPPYFPADPWIFFLRRRFRYSPPRCFLHGVCRL